MSEHSDGIVAVILAIQFAAGFICGLTVRTGGDEWRKAAQSWKAAFQSWREVWRERGPGKP